MSLTDAYRSTGTKTCPSVPVPLHPQHVSRVLVCMKPGPPRQARRHFKVFCLFVFGATQPPSRPGTPHSRGF